MTPTPDIQHITYQSFQLAYRQVGYGPAILLAFHGIGQDSGCFLPLADTIGQQFTIYSFDLFFHGASPGPASEEFVLTKTDWTRIVSEFLKEKSISRFSVMGFSMGGKFALVIAEAFADRLDQLILLAPDGITISPWYKLATGTALGRALFRYFIDHMPLFSRAGRGLAALGLVDRSVLRFVQSTLSTVDQRERVYRSWVGFRKLKVKLDTLAHTLNHHAVRIRFFVGCFDRVLPVHFTKPLTRRLHTYELIMLKTGHHRLIEKAATAI
ncbi:hypothetical protein GCM10023189_52640 [Nibrella saemangeumensis]|uniref:AB hydrolase-1 domain-containing protein n=1 Tax=Nibrella saemangeumensis TaxID=1084526 RepID=A0ABP8NIV4_9BACT